MRRVVNRQVEITTGAGLAIIRLAAFAVLFSRQSADAQWQLVYLPLSAADFPLSLSYRYLPFPLPEAVLGPLWWFCIGFGISFIVREKTRFHRQSG